MKNTAEDRRRPTVDSKRKRWWFTRLGASTIATKAIADPHRSGRLP
jgi:hypothetical protein